MVEYKAANTCAPVETGKRVKKISAFPVDAMGECGRSGYKIKAGDRGIR
jgi:hypothetical protein